MFTTVADQAARETGFVQRHSKLSGARFVQALTFGWLGQPDASLGQLAQMAATLGVPCVTTISGAQACVTALDVLQKQAIRVQPLQSYHARIGTSRTVSHA